MNCSSRLFKARYLLPMAEVLDDSYLEAVMSKLTSSKNQRLIFKAIWGQTYAVGKRSRCFLNDVFIEGGVDSKNPNVAINRACRELVKKGLITKFVDYLHRFDCTAYRYSLREEGIKQFIGESI